jgi:glycerophosphoryl diester phosphodiesterase
MFTLRKIMKVFAHRGFSGKYPENTMLAFEKAVEVKADGIELDVHCTKDGKLVIIHDEKLERTSGKPGVVSDYTLSEITAIEANLTHPECHGTTIPSFDEYCSYIRDKEMVTNVEIKTNLYYYADIEGKLLQALKHWNIEDKVIISSFNWLSVARFKKLAPHITCGLLLERQHMIDVAVLAKEMGIEYYHPDIGIIDDEDVACCKKNGIGINCWTVNTSEQMKKLIEWDADGAIGNFPDMALKALSRA